MKTPLELIKKSLAGEIPSELLCKMPVKWEKVGNVLTMIMPEELESYKKNIAEKYAMVLGCKTVLNDIGGISGEYREPNVEIIFGSSNVETVHKENRVKFKVDPSKVMFSSGNIDERIRMARVSNSNETVVDLFAGIGYFTLPMAVHSRPEKIYAIEKNPVSFNYLSQNIVLNNVTHIVEPILGDNRKMAPKDVADRVLLGYFGNTIQFLPIAVESLKNKCGIIHFHDKFPEDSVPDKPLEIIKSNLEKYNRTCELIGYKHVKTYAPGISHYVFDIKVGEK